tara:strand:+ start:626 stop:772 length:147 start_codon:yes stop_codon:yes gene_type:complete
VEQAVVELEDQVAVILVLQEQLTPEVVVVVVAAEVEVEIIKVQMAVQV